MSAGFVSHAGQLEDVMLWRALGHLATGFYVDVGAADPHAGSVTRAFYERGWRGVNLEPGAARLRALRLARPFDVNLALAAAAAPGSAVFSRSTAAAPASTRTRPGAPPPPA